MKNIYKVHYENSITKAREIYRNRFNFETTIQLPFFIKPYQSTEQLQLYYLPTLKIEQLLVDIYKFDKIIENLVDDLPPIAQLNFILDIQLEELQNTNEIEGVRSTKKELGNIKKKMQEDNKTRLRFRSLIQSYDKLLKGEIARIQHSSDVRKIYNDLVLEEITEENLPDGEIFTKESSQVSRKSGTGKVIHEGLTSENKKVEYIDSVIAFMNNENLKLPMLIKVCIFHFLFGYVHPFYDGNGRTSRFITSMYLNEELSRWTSISLSRGCKKNQNDYLNAFEYANMTTNFGEMNVFIEKFLSIILSSQKITLMDLSEKTNLLNSFISYLEQEKSLEKKELERKIVFVLAQDFYFAIDNDGLTRKDLREIFTKHPQSHIVPALNYLVANNFVVEKGKSPIYYKLKSDIFD